MPQEISNIDDPVLTNDSILLIKLTSTFSFKSSNIDSLNVLNFNIYQYYWSKILINAQEIGGFLDFIHKIFHCLLMLIVGISIDDIIFYRVFFEIYFKNV